jgi:hypothetical protein
VQKSAAEWIVLLMAIGGILALFVPYFPADISDQDKGKITLTATIILSLAIIVFGPLQKAFQESMNKDAEIKTKEAEIKDLADKLSSGPTIRMDDIRLDKRYNETTKIFEMRVKNDGGGTVEVDPKNWTVE